AAYLIYLSYQHFFLSDPEARRTPPRAKPWLGLSAFWATVVKVELTDIVFAIDSILVAVAMSPKIWVILTGGLLGIVAIRLVIGRLLSLIERYPPLVDGAFVIIAWVGMKLLIEFLHKSGYIGLEIPNWVSLGLIVVIFVVSFLYARAQPQRASARDDDAARHLFDDQPTPEQQKPEKDRREGRGGGKRPGSAPEPTRRPARPRSPARGLASAAHGRAAPAGAFRFPQAWAAASDPHTAAAPPPSEGDDRPGRVRPHAAFARTDG